MSATILSVAPVSPAARAGVLQGDELLEIQGKAPLDILDYLYGAASSRVAMRVARNGVPMEMRIRKRAEEPLGIDFKDEVFNGIRRCRNRCVFCFLDQNAPGMRRTLYVRDDDYRLSFLHGNFITLTNMREDDFRRIEALRLDPLYISVHSTDPDVRSRIFGTPRAASIGESLERLVRARISFHTQIVVCPGLNDGAHLEKTLADLTAYYPHILSIALVPAGLTRFHTGGVTAVTPDHAREVYTIASRFQRRLARELGANFLYLSDELHLLLGRPFPSNAHYHDYPQWENGVGMCRLFIHELNARRRYAPRRLARPERVALVTGTSFARVLLPLLGELPPVEGLTLKPVVVRNRFYGESVTVAGLLTGEDIMDALKAVDADRIFLPTTCLRGGEAFLDGVTLAQLRGAVSGEVVPVLPRGGEFLKALFPR